MATVLTEPETECETDYDPSETDIALLEDKMPDWFRTSPATAGWVLIVGICFVVLNLRPLWHTDLWGHLAYARQIWEAGALPATETLMPLSEGVRFVDSAWLTQLLAYGAYQVADRVGIVFLYAFSGAMALGVLSARVFDRTQSYVFAAAVLAMTMFVEWQQLAIVRPQCAGFLFFAVLLSVLLKRSWSRSNWWLVPGMFALWANMHGSFAIGLALLGCFAVGRAFDVLVRTRTPRGLWHDRKLRRLILLTELSAVATLLNPYGLQLWTEIIAFGSNSNLESVIEWKSLHIRMVQGQAAFALGLLLFVVYRFSPRRMGSSEFLAIAGLGAGMLWTSRLLMWWGPVAATLIAIHGAAAWRRARRWELSPEPPARASMWTVVAVFLGLIFLQISRPGTMLLKQILGQGAIAYSEQIPVSMNTPVEATKYLVDNPPEGLVFNTYEWGDYMVWAGPKDMQVMVTSHAHLVPHEVWDDYMGMIEMRSGWDSMLDRYGVNTVVLDKQYRSGMIDRFRPSEDWRRVYEDDRAAIFERREPI
ncbi:MAG: hypothetical protein ACYTGL_08825 [Planctomycetota bacterium]|jgi:hypothetical protein